MPLYVFTIGNNSRMTKTVRHRPVTIDQVTYQVPTNVSWNPQRSRWTVSIQVNKLANQTFFPVENYDNNIRTAFEEAVAFANEHRTVRSSRKPAHDRRRVRDYRPLPKGIYALEVGNKLKLLATDLLFKHIGVVWVGNVDTFTNDDYYSALEKAMSMKRQRDETLVRLAQAKDAEASSAVHRVDIREVEMVREKLNEYDKAKRDLYGKFAKATA